ncbi:MAG TPA: nucleoside hydrolase [Candidatus Binatia bacterium]|jgi:pyrimidine-specific ribonucleoside hydrolase|nr:nucleoside hydrolase [Candidatus Binatia bacterium]
MSTAVWIDTDPAVGLPRADVDDGLALIQAFNSPELAVRGIGVVFGNAPLADAAPIATEIAQRFGPPGLRVHPGASSAGMLGTDTPAVRALAEALAAESLTILALGPLTNVATLLLRHPTLASRIHEIVCVAGRRPGQEFRSTPHQRDPFPDLNFECDPEAMAVLLRSDVALVLAPWELSSHVWIGAAELDAMAAAGGAPAWLAARSRDWLGFWERELHAPGFNPFDTLAVGWVIDPGMIEHVVADATIEPGPQLVVRPPAGGRRVVYCERPGPEFVPSLMARLTRT